MRELVWEATKQIQSLVIAGLALWIGRIAWNYWSPIPSSMLSRRLQQLLEWHDLTGPQLLYLIKPEWKWTASDVSDPDRLASLCQSEHLEWFADTFGVNRAWLDGTSDTISQTLSAYKWLDEFVRQMREGGWLHPSLRMTILTCDYRGAKEPLGDYAIVFSRLIEPDHPEAPVVYRYVLVEGFAWRWSHYPARRDTKTIARWFSRVFHSCDEIPVVSIGSKDLKEVVDLKVSPGKFLGDDACRDEFFEDRVLLERESVVAIPSPETEGIIDYLRSSPLMSARLPAPSV
ncbi:hypothetical protein [Bremerella cremea]|uniref:hypothetical protein n=1 Tax=Bremerella cremea TaxID=1031537 RepID=UPI0031EFF6F4